MDFLKNEHCAILARAELMMPFLLCRAGLHSEPTERNQFLHTLFNLIKRPDDKQSK
ncbi:hypothetical protein GH733_013440 [Mirounga leonina]|nr:hypothetical protein GH733_013440 [Mirounga leonina]